MLVLSRRVGERIIIGDAVKIVVVAVEGGQVRLGIDAPKEVKVWREELYQKKQREQEKGEA